MSGFWISGSCGHGELLEGRKAVGFELSVAVDVCGLNSAVVTEGRMDALVARHGAAASSQPVSGRKTRRTDKPIRPRDDRCGASRSGAQR